MNLLWLDGDAMDAVSVEGATNAVGYVHVVFAWSDEDVYTGDDSRLGQLPDVQFVHRHDTVDIVDRVADGIERDVGRDGLHQDVRGRLDCEELACASLSGYQWEHTDPEA